MGGSEELWRPLPAVEVALVAVSRNVSLFAAVMQCLCSLVTAMMMLSLEVFSAAAWEGGRWTRVISPFAAGAFSCTRTR